MVSVRLRGKRREEAGTGVEATAKELEAALAGHGITLPLMGPEPVTTAGAHADGLVSLGNCTVDVARDLAAVLRGLDAGRDVVQRPPLRVRLLAQPYAVSDLRRSVRRLLGLWGLPKLADGAQLCVSELVTNVIRHVGEGSPMTLRMFLVEDRLRIEVTDPDPYDLPVLTDVPADAESGRGMALLEMLTLRWGVERHPDGKTTWCELDAGPPGAVRVHG